MDAAFPVSPTDAVVLLKNYELVYVGTGRYDEGVPHFAATPPGRLAADVAHCGHISLAVGCYYVGIAVCVSREVTGVSPDMGSTNTV
jgi:hypothetical protein